MGATVKCRGNLYYVVVVCEQRTHTIKANSQGQKVGVGTSPLFVYIPLIIGFLSLRGVEPVSCSEY